MSLTSLRTAAVDRAAVALVRRKDQAAKAAAAAAALRRLSGCFGAAI
jgi:hypothetical protein